jgi:squalene-associated FAD-dependent desaturase
MKPQTTPTPHHCVIVGAGFAGASAAVRLAEAGVRVTLVEARTEAGLPCAGGRVQSLLDRETGETIDNGQHLLMGCYDATLRLLETLGTMPLLRRQKALRVWFGDCTGAGDGADIFALDASRLPAELGMAWGMLGLRGLSVREKVDLVRFAGRLRLNWIPTKGKTAWELLREERQSERVITRLWEPIILATLNTSVQKASATLLVQVMRLAFLGGREAAQMLIAETGLAEVLAPLPDWLEQHGSRMVTGLVKRIVFNEQYSRVVGIELASGENILTGSVITALPAQMALKLLPEDVRQASYFQAWKAFESSPIVSVYLWCDVDFMQQDFIALLGTQTQWVFNRRKLCIAPNDVRERFAGHISLTISAANALANESQERIVEVCWSELQRAFPMARTAQLLRSRVIRERHATPLFAPENEHLRPSPVTPLGGLFLAGDWTNTGLPATIESASRSGENAANAVLAGKIER